MLHLPGTPLQNSYMQKLPGGRFRKGLSARQANRPSHATAGIGGNKVNHLSDLRSGTVRQQAAMVPQTLLAFVGFGGR